MVVQCRESNDFLLPAMITFLNDRDWQLRAAFFHHICEMGAYAGNEGLQAFLLPCLEQVSPLPLLSGISETLSGIQKRSRVPEW
jgi:hypothetical protein